MLSETLSNLLAHMEQNVSTATEREAVRGARMHLAVEAAAKACYRCPNAGWLVEFASRDGNDEWLFGLGKCGAGMALQPYDEAPVLRIPVARFCSGQFESASGATHAGLGTHVPISRTLAANEMSKLKPQRDGGN